MKSPDWQMEILKIMIGDDGDAGDQWEAPAGSRTIDPPSRSPRHLSTD